MFLRETCLEGGILPVVALRRLVQTVTHLTVVVHLVPQVSPLPSIQEVQLLADGAPTESGTIVDVVLAVRAFLGGDDDHTVGTTRTIDSGGRDVLQHLDAFNV